MNNISLCEYTTFHLSIHQLTGIWVISAFWLLLIMLIWTFMYKFLYGCIYVGYIVPRSWIAGSHGNIGLPKWLSGKEPVYWARDTSSIPVSKRCPGRWHGDLLWYSCLENSIDRGAWWASVHRVTKSQTRLKQLSTAHGTQKFLIESRSLSCTWFTNILSHFVSCLFTFW